MSEEMNVQKRVIGNQAQTTDTTFDRVLSHMAVIERHFKDDLDWINTISNNATLFSTTDNINTAQKVFYDRMDNIQDDLHSLLEMRGYLKDRYGVGKMGITDAYDFGNPQEFLLISLQNDLNRLIVMAKALLDLYDNIIERTDSFYANDDEEDETPSPSADFETFAATQYKEEMNNNE